MTKGALTRWRTPAILAGSVAVHAVVLGVLGMRAVQMDAWSGPERPVVLIQIEPRPLLQGERPREPVFAAPQPSSERTAERPSLTVPEPGLIRQYNAIVRGERRQVLPIVRQRGCTGGVARVRIGAELEQQPDHARAVDDMQMDVESFIKQDLLNAAVVVLFTERIAL